MSLDGASPIGSPGQSSQDIVVSSKTKPKPSGTVDKTSQVFKEALPTEAEEEAYRASEREYYVQDIMNTKGVTRDVALAEYHFFMGD